MSLIERQDLLVAQLQPIHRERIELGNGGGGRFGGLRARAKNKHIAAMLAAGYSRREAAESAQQCDDMAALNASYEAHAKNTGSEAS